MHGARGQHKNAAQPQGAGALLDALEQLFSIAGALALRRYGDGGHLGGFGFGVGVKRGTAKDHAVMLDDGVALDVALDFGAVAFDQRAVFFKRLNQLQDAAHIVDGGLAQFFELLVDHHGADAVVYIHLQQQRAVQRKRDDVAALYARLASLDAVLQIKTRVGGVLRGGQLGQQGLGAGQGQLGVDGVVFAGGLTGLHADAGHLGQKNQLVGLERHRHRGGHLFHGQVEGFARGGEAQWRQQHQRTHVQRALDARHIDLAHQTRMLEVHAIDDAHGPCGEEVARDHAHRGTRHGGVGQALAERGLNLVAQLACGLLRAIERHRVGDADAVRVFGGMPFGSQLLVHLRAKTMHQHDAHPHGLDQRQVLGDVLQLARRDAFAREANHKRLVAKLVDVRRHRAEPGDEGEVEDSRHGAGQGVGRWGK